MLVSIQCQDEFMGAKFAMSMRESEFTMLDLACEIQTTPENTRQCKNIIENSKGLLCLETIGSHTKEKG